jgi:hypothetical protein
MLPRTPRNKRYASVIVIATAARHNAQSIGQLTSRGQPQFVSKDELDYPEWPNARDDVEHTWGWQLGSRAEFEAHKNSLSPLN